MAIDEIVNLLRKKGFVKHATLLQSRNGEKYAYALNYNRWKPEVKKAFGEKTYRLIKKQVNEEMNSLDGLRLLAAIKGYPFYDSFQPRNYQSEPLEIKIQKPFDESDLKTALESVQLVIRLVGAANKIIYGEVQAQTQNNPDLLFEIYKGVGTVYQLDRRSYEERVDWFKGSLKESYNRGKDIRNMGINPSSILYDFRITHIEKFIGHIDGGTILEKRLDDALGEAEKTLEDPALLNKRYDEYERRLRRSERSGVIEDGRSIINGNINDDEASFIGGFWDSMIATVEMERFSGKDVGTVEQKSLKDIGYLTKLLLKTSLEGRRDILESYEISITDINDSLIGIKQILEGGPITDPNATPVSTLQNHGNFPNIVYSERAKQELQAIAAQLQLDLDQLPDISDLATPSKLRGGKSLVYTMEELPKNPLDITFGNDSGCCIFVPDDIKELENGFYVADYITNPYVRLFGVYKAKNGKKQRMGLVITFDTTKEDDENTKILACNSLELSRFGIAGGQNTIRALTEFIENEIANYARINGYDGAVMGAHSYNTSANYSGKASNRLTEMLVFNGLNDVFYSDIFGYHKKTKRLITRPNSVYWLWRK